ncbi:MAG: redoxin domain-containing protein [Cyanobacteria bacterium P01_B01_bin.77]
MLLNTPACEVGQQAPTFTLSDPDGKTYSLESLMGEKGLLVAFIYNHCPYVQAVIDRFVADAKLLQADGVNVVAVMSNDYRYVPVDSPTNMKKIAQQHGFPFPYLVDIHWEPPMAKKLRSLSKKWPCPMRPTGSILWQAISLPMNL